MLGIAMLCGGDAGSPGRVIGVIGGRGTDVFEGIVDCGLAVVEGASISVPAADALGCGADR
jgi:hypothetical protein